MPAAVSSVIDAALRVIDALFVAPDPEIRQGVDARVVLVTGDDLLGLSVDHYFSDVCLVDTLSQSLDTPGSSVI